MKVRVKSELIMFFIRIKIYNYLEKYILFHSISDEPTFKLIVVTGVRLPKKIFGTKLNFILIQNSYVCLI